jgi:hypothetical protein
MHKVEDYIIQIGVMKIYVETMEAFTKKKNMIKLNLPSKLCWRHVNDLKHPLTVVSTKSNYMHK